MNKPCAYWEERLALRPEDLSPSERIALNAHLSTCVTCSRIQASNLLLIQQFHALPPLSKKQPPARLFQPKESDRIDTNALFSEQSSNGPESPETGGDDRTEIPPMVANWHQPPTSEKRELLFSQDLATLNLQDFDALSAFIKERVDAMRSPAQQWADLARLAVKGLPHDTYQLAMLEAQINAMRAELRSIVIAATEHFSDEQLNKLRKDIGISKYAWRALKKQRPVTTRYGFTYIDAIFNNFRQKE